MRNQTPRGGNITGIAESGNITAAGPRTRTRTLDAINRLTRVMNAAGQGTESYTLDGAAE